MDTPIFATRATIWLEARNALGASKWLRLRAGCACGSCAGAVQDKAAVPAQTADTPFADSAGVQRQQSQAVADALEDADLSADLDNDTASTLAPSTSALKSEMGESESGEQGL